MLIALFERAVGFYASFIGINAYHQPAVEFGKKAAGEIIALKNRLEAELWKRRGYFYSARELAQDLSADETLVWHLLRHLAQNEDCAVEGAEAQELCFGINV